MRRLGKRVLAIALAAAMMTSLSPEACTFLQQEIVYAAEMSAFYEQTAAVTSAKLSILEENWSDKKETVITESVTGVNTTANFDMTADIAIDQEGYDSLQAEESYLKLQGVVKISDNWTWTDSQDIPYLDKNSFQKDGDVYKTSITIKFRDINEDKLKGVYFEAVGKGFQGTITYSNTKLTEVAVATSKEVLAYSSDKTATDAFDFSSIKAEDDEDWGTTIKQLDVDNAASGATITENAVFRGKITIDQEAYDSLSAEGSYIKLQTVMKLGEGYTWTQGGSYPYLNLGTFSANGDGTYSAQFEDKFSGTDGGDLKEVIVRAVGKLAKGTITVSDISIYNVISADEPLPVKGATVIDDFEAAQLGTANGWENEAGWQYDKVIEPVVASEAGSKMLQLNLDYTGCEGYSWSEAKVKKSFADGLDVSAYNILTYDLVYPAELDGKFKVKVFAKEASSGQEIINKEGTVETVDLGDGMKKATVTVKFSPNTAKITDLTLGTVGVNTAFKGSVYLDNIKLSQYDATADFVTITSTADNGNATKANNAGMESTVSLADSQASNSALALYSYLKNLDKNNQVLFGHQNDTHKSVSKTAAGGSDTKDMTNSISGVVGIDSLALTGAELGLTDTKAAVAESIKIGKEAAGDGAILTLSTHMPNMSNSKIVKTADGYDFSACDFAESKDLSNNCSMEVLPGGKYNEQFKAYLDIIAEYAKGLGDTPVLFRPFHEGDGSWFWWGSATTDNETYKALYRYTEDYLTSQGVHNFIYVYSPCGPTDANTYENRYPGDDYVDILAFDYYDDYSSATAAYSDAFFTNLKQSCNTIKKLADQKGKVAAIAEAGVRVMKADGSDQEGILVKNNPIKDHQWYSNINRVAQETGMSYFLLWANFSDTNFYIPYKYNDTKGQELINEFIDFYNEDSSLFADGTNFYGGADQKAVSNTNQGDTANGYITSIASKGVIKTPTKIKANVKNAKSVQFVLKNGAVTKELSAKETGNGQYEAEVTAEIIRSLGRTDTGTIELVADGSTLTTLNYISFGKDKEVLASNVVENFDLYFGDNDYLGGNFSTNSAAGCSSSIILDKEHAQSKEYAGAFTYTLAGDGAYTGRIKSANYNFSTYNALQMWVQPDGKGQKLIIQIADGSGEEFEVNLTEFVKGTKAQYVTIPFSSFVGKQGGTLDTSNITKFAIYCNKIDQDLTSTIYFDNIQAVRIKNADLAKKDSAGLIITDEAIGTTKTGNGGGSSSGSTVTDPAEKDTSVTTEVKPDGTIVKTQVINDIAKNTTATVTVETDKSGKVSASAEVVASGSSTLSGTKGTISAAVVAQIVEAAGTKNVAITQTVTNSKGEEVFTVTVNAKDIKEGKSLSIVKIDPKTGNYVLVNAKQYKVTKAGNVSVTMKDEGDYALLNEGDAKKLNKEILATVQVKTKSKTVKSGKKTKITLSDKLNKDNVSKITYSSTKKSVVKVDKKGNVTAKKAGTATVKAKVTLKNGKTKTVTMKVKVK